uniref:ER membrane protein complex subunit 3 n=1 Tax=Eucampia antarctica TaxID=49252 RepID=A0A6U0S2U7_9STRA|mmetsp:Transcript_24789/g.23815  ORF Transcript_24789/g.23815 Transcript_24789/m.23815 type:complete len:121 (+) Transcript_24789:127-489(+)
MMTYKSNIFVSLVVITIFNLCNNRAFGFVNPSSSIGVVVHPSVAFAPIILKSSTELGIFNKKQEVDLSDIESRDMTREEMLELNKQNEEIMNMELSAMTGFSFVLSLPIFYLCWVAFFSD